MTAKIQLIGVKKRFGPKVVLDGVDLTIEKQSSVVIIGGSGTGKSVTIKSILGIIRPDEGTILVDGEDVTHISGAARDRVMRKFGMLFQGAALFDSMTVGENVGLVLREVLRWDDARIRERVRERLEWVGLRDVEKQKPASLSGGMRKRVGLARAIVMDPQFILYDEPTTGLDPIMADVIDQLVRSLQRRLGVTAVVVTHDMTSAFKVADRVAMLHEGRIVYSGTVAETRNTGDPLVRQFIEGSSEGPLAT
jgi:phospholipid/cholesterol/gamma-HCH transport system ATP-binding protein